MRLPHNVRLLGGEQPSTVTAEPGFRAVIQSPEYGKLAPEKRKALLELVKKMSPEEWQQLVDRLARKV
jgi:hypothetical protein